MCEPEELFDTLSHTASRILRVQIADVVDGSTNPLVLLYADPFGP